jgi:hypothetical protein
MAAAGKACQLQVGANAAHHARLWKKNEWEKCVQLLEVLFFFTLVRPSMFVCVCVCVCVCVSTLPLSAGKILYSTISSKNAVKVIVREVEYSICIFLFNRT